MYKIIETYIAGCSFDNQDGSCRREILSNLKLDSELILENYFFENEKAVRILTVNNRCIGNIPKEFAKQIFDFNEKEKIKVALFRPKKHQNGTISYYIKLYIK